MNLPIPFLFLLLAALMAAAMALAWTIARHPGKSGWTDTIWSYATGACGALGALLVPLGDPKRHWLVAVLAACWGVRLGTHILGRTLKGKEDPRYAELKRQWGRDWQKRLFGFLMIQAGAGLFLAISIVAAAANPAPAFAWSDFAGAAILAVAVLGEGIADRQLRAFAADPSNRGKVMDRGLWRWSRHPNYFFEWLAWWAYPVIALGADPFWPWGLLALTGPAFIYWLLVHVSGIPPLEQHMERSRGEAFRAYRRRVNAFFPGPPGLSRASASAPRKSLRLRRRQ